MTKLKNAFSNFAKTIKNQQDMDQNNVEEEAMVMLIITRMLV